MFGSQKFGSWKHPGYNKGGSTTSTQQNYSPEEAAERAKIMQEASRIYGSTKDSLANSVYPGAVPVAPSAETKSAMNAATNYAIGPAQDQANNINSAVQFGLHDVLFPETNPALQSTIDAAVRPITESYTDPDGVMAAIRTGAVNSGQYGSSRQGIAEGIAAGRYADAVGDASSKIATEGYGKGLDTFSRTLAFSPQALQAGLMPSTILSGIGAQKEGYGAEMENYLANSRMWDLNSEWLPLQNYASLIYGGSNPGTTTTSSGGGPSGLETGMQVASTAASAYLAYAAATAL